LTHCLNAHLLLMNVLLVSFAESSKQIHQTGNLGFGTFQFSVLNAYTVRC
jgi:hypothetical protein